MYVQTTYSETCFYHKFMLYLFQTDLNRDQDSDTDMIIDHSELSIGENSGVSASPSLQSNSDRGHTEVRTGHLLTNSGTVLTFNTVIKLATY